MISDFSLVLPELPFINSDFYLFPFLVQEALKTLAVSSLPHNAQSSPSAAAPPPLSRPHVPMTPIPGTPDTLASIQLLTARYRRRPLTVDEMDYIQVRSQTDMSLTTGGSEKDEVLVCTDIKEFKLIYKNRKIITHLP